MSDDKREIRDLVDSWMAASKAGDLETIMDLMTDDVLFMTPGNEPFGKEQFGAASKAMAGTMMDGQASIQEVEVIGDWAWVRNHIDLRITPQDGAEIHRSGYTLTILRKGNDGRWRLFRDANLVS